MSCLTCLAAAGIEGLIAFSSSQRLASSPSALRSQARCCQLPHVEQQRSKAEQLCTLMQVDQELLLDYGSTYWKTRENKKLD